RRPHPHGHHRGEVERRDPGDDAVRLADRVDVDPGRSLLRVAALQQLGDAAAELDHLEPARDLALRVGQDLAVLERQQAREVVAVRVEELSDAEEELGSAREGDGAPALEGALGRLDGRVDLLGRREVDLAALLAGGRVVDRAAATRRALDAPAVDPVRDPRDLARLLFGELLRYLGHLPPPSSQRQSSARIVPWLSNRA